MAPTGGSAWAANRDELTLGAQSVGARGVLVLCLLLFANILNFVDRLLPSVLVESIRHDLHLKDTQIGLIGGLAFAVIYSFAGVGIARIADRSSPRWVIAISLALWSFATAVSGLAQNFIQLFLTRASVAAGEAGSTPAAHALIASTYPRDRRSFVMAIFSLGVPIGAMLGLSMGGWINDALNWRAAFFVVGLPGLALALAIRLFVPDPPRQVLLGRSVDKFSNTLRLLFALRCFRHMVAACSLFGIGSYSLNIFTAAFLIRTHHLTATRAGAAFGFAFGVGGFLGTVIGGALADWLGRRDVRWRLGVPALGVLISAPAAFVAFTSPSPMVAVICLMLTYLFGLAYYAPTFACLQSLVPDRVRATAAGILLFFLTLIGASVGPWLVGFMSDMLAPQYGVLSLRYAMILVPVTMLWSALHFYLAARALPAGLALTSEQHARADAQL
jgi:MFS transporter, Spinster family, sphingosine-1-phosphate transporter